MESTLPAVQAAAVPDGSLAGERYGRSRRCPLCDGAGSPEVGRHGAWRLVECDGCGLVYMPEIPSDAAVEQDFDWHQTFRRERWQRWLKSPLARLWTGAFILLKPDRDRRALRRIRRFAPPGRMLDVGAGTGRLAWFAQRAGYEPYCVELSPGMAARARERIGAERVHVGRLWDCPLTPGSFDLVVAVSFLEHEAEPLRLLERAGELLRPGGVVAVKVPNYDCLLHRLRGRRWSGFRWPEHVQYFTPKTLRAMFERAGLEVIHTGASALSDNLWMFARSPSSAGSTKP